MSTAAFCWNIAGTVAGFEAEALEEEVPVAEAPMDKVEEMINKLGDAGIYTLIDAHQDVFARSICGEGVPDFYTKRAVGDNPTCINSYVD